MVGATVVLANATAVNCSEKENSDLFWALRGAGSSFGVVTSYLFNTFAAPSQVTTFTVNLPWSSGDSCASGWSALQDYLLSGGMPAEMNMRVFGGGFQTQLQGSYHGSASALQSAISPLLQKLGATMSTQTSDWNGGFTAYANGDRVDVTHPYGNVSASTRPSRHMVGVFPLTAPFSFVARKLLFQVAGNDRSSTRHDALGLQLLDGNR